MVKQPPNSPDMNILDLGFSRAIQSLQHQQSMAGIDELISATVKAFEDLEPEKLSNIFLTWQQCMIEVIKHDGANKYKVPYMGRRRCGMRACWLPPWIVQRTFAFKEWPVLAKLSNHTPNDDLIVRQII